MSSNLLALEPASVSCNKVPSFCCAGDPILGRRVVVAHGLDIWDQPIVAQHPHMKDELVRNAPFFFDDISVGFF